MKVLEFLQTILITPSDYSTSSIWGNSESSYLRRISLSLNLVNIGTEERKTILIINTKESLLVQSIIKMFGIL